MQQSTRLISSAFGTEEEATEGERRQEERGEPMGHRAEASAFKKIIVYNPCEDACIF